jgi:hypothetical protein
MRASDDDREQAIGVLKAAFVQGRLDRDELDDRVSRAFTSRTYAELAAVTADLPAGPAVATPSQPVRAQEEPMRRPGRMIAVATAVYGGAWAYVLWLPPNGGIIPRPS